MIKECQKHNVQKRHRTVQLNLYIFTPKIVKIIKVGLVELFDA